MHIDDNDHEDYISMLKDLVSINSIYTNEIGILECLQYCENSLKNSLINWEIWRDKKGNLICVNPKLDKKKPYVFLSAHVDTVGAEASKWVSSPDPFTAIETNSHIIGRGANDCKAGVAFMLLVGSLLSKDKLLNQNIGFLFSYREEGNQEKTSSEIGREIGKKIPISDVSNCILCLENTVSIKDKSVSLGLYNREPTNLFIEIEGYITEIRDFLKHWPAWKPIAITPIESVTQKGDLINISNTGGHSATIENDKNVIFDFLCKKASNNNVILGGDFSQTSVITNSITVFSSKQQFKHRLVLNLRSFDEIDTTRERLKGIRYKEYHPFEYGEGSVRNNHPLTKEIIQSINPISLDNPALNVMDNPGRSDASAMWTQFDSALKKRVAILTMGPGTRTHIDHEIRRATHGPDEGYHKEAGYSALTLLLEIIVKITCSNAKY